MKTIALLGNPNSGKTSLFNVLTGGRQHVGNWPGVTVEKKEGFVMLGHERFHLMDLPGLYSLEPDSPEQKLAGDYLLKEKPALILNIVDASNLERNLYLTLQLRELNMPMIVVLNMMDEVEKQSIHIDAEQLSKMLDIPVYAISATKKHGLRELTHAMHKHMDMPTPKTFSLACGSCSLCKKGEQRYRLVEHMVSACQHTEISQQKQSRTTWLDKILLNRVLALPIFLLIMYAIFTLTFEIGSGLVSGFLDGFLNITLRDGLSSWLTFLAAPAWLISLLCDGVIAGVGTILLFLPQIALLFFFLSLLEDSGYMARAAFMMDKIFSVFGLSGSSFIPLMMGFGCTVPAVMACRILGNERDRKLTILLAPFMSCSARLPVYALFAGVFFKQNQGLIVFSLYLLGIVVALLSALILSKTVLKSKGSGFVMEIPPYRLPQLRNMLLHTWEKVKGFVIRAGTVLLIASMVVWFLQSFSTSLIMVTNGNESILAKLGGIIAPIFAPLGFGTWQASTALLTGVAAKEMIVSTLAVVSGAGSASPVMMVSQMFSPLTSYVFMAFSLLYMPCLSTIVTMRKELGSRKWTLFGLGYSFVVAWVISFIIYQAGLLLKL